jgi:hypothetical protein
MRIQVLSGRPDERLSKALQAFEQQFRYPLDQGWFRIAHGDDYSAFYRSLGTATCIVAEDDQGIAGVCCAATRTLHRPGMPPQQVLYLGDLKVASKLRGGRVLWRLSEAMRACHPGIAAAYCIVMHGTARTPDFYTGRAGLPGFQAIGELRLWHLPAVLHGASSAVTDDVIAVSASTGEELFRQLSASHCFCLDGNPRQRSLLPVQWWISADGKACGRLEDTRAAKRLLRDNGEEMVSAHLSAFAYAAPDSGERLLRAMIQRTAEAAYPALFVALPDGEKNLPMMLAHPPEGTVISGATIYGTALAGNVPWKIFTAEI